MDAQPNTSTEYATFGPGAMHLACACIKPAGWVIPQLPDDPPRFEEPTYVQPLGILMAPYGVIVFTVAVRPAYDDGTVRDWLNYLCKSASLDVERVSAVTVNGLPALAAESSQPSEMGLMHVRAVFLENDRRLFLLNAMAPQQVWPSVEPVFEQLFASFRLAHVAAPTAPLGEADPDPASAPPSSAPSPAESDESKRFRFEGIVTEDPRAVANTAEPLNLPPTAPPKQPAPPPREDGPEWWVKAIGLERQDKLAEAEALLEASIDHLGCYSQIAHLYERRAARLSHAGDADGARAAARAARDWLYRYASCATSGGEGTALSRERDQRVSQLAHMLN